VTTNVVKCIWVKCSEGLSNRLSTFGTQVRGFKPAEAVGFLRVNKNPQHAFLRRGSKAACKRSLKCNVEGDI
jgi:hypothetical protein